MGRSLRQGHRGLTPGRPRFSHGTWGQAGSRFHRAFPTKSESGVSPPSCGDAGPAGAGPLPHFPALLPQQPPPGRYAGVRAPTCVFWGGTLQSPRMAFACCGRVSPGPVSCRQPHICGRDTACRRPSWWGARVLSPKPAPGPPHPGMPAAVSAVSVTCTGPCPHALIRVIVHQRLSGKFIIF